jgi:putative aldouronate transport system permease protein
MMSKTKINKSLSGRLFDISNYAFISIFCFMVLYPFWDLFVLSFAGKDEVLSLGLHLWPKRLNFDSYKLIFSSHQIMTAYINTIGRAVAGVVIGVTANFSAAYPLSKNNLPGRNIFMKYFIIPMYISGGLIPVYLIYRDIGLLNNRLVYILPVFISFYNLVMIRNFLMSLEKALEESALIDGAGYITILVKIIAPLCKPIIATVALWECVAHWNYWFDCYIFITDPNKEVLQVLLQRQIMNLAKTAIDQMKLLTDDVKIFPENVKAATILITIGPIIAVYPFAQKYFVKGIMVGSVKG